ncbi:Flp pilus assembly protein CpaB [Actinoallomurus iriomotensis]|uniref:Flp pilus assembly protein CpaB n=1 Tax=Actinoallomurus iriomotensis TaxID=478107 RepID=A0A9W6S175_9ACTN|nr:Flp pilus assembly protein CpaB [Actinoallomurus iriomotensis]GLY85318.1 Flp pilus assembly protein CpaB [Actinoallomurus iriomotensis]
MNPRQRRGLLLVIVAAVGALVVFVSVLAYVGRVRADARASVGELTTVFQVQSAVAAYQAVTVGNLRRVGVPRRWMSGAFVQSVAELQGTVAAADIPVGAYLQRGMVVPAPELQPGQREIAIMIDAEAGVAGKVKPGATVDVYSTFDAAQQGSSSAACAVRILNRVRVIDVGNLRSEPDAQQQGVVNQVVPVTFALDSDETLKLTYAESFSRKVRLALVGGAKDATPPFNRLCHTPEAGK